MKHLKSLLLVLLVAILPLSISAQEKSITLEYALAIVQKYYNKSNNVDYYLLTERIDNWSIFVDEVPQANWAHECAIYTFPNTGDLNCDTIPEIQRFNLPPAEDMTELLSPNRIMARDSDTNFETHVIASSSFIKSNPEVANRTYAVIVNGGYYYAFNDPRYWRDCSFIYQTLTKTYCIPHINIEVLMADGTDPNEDIQIDAGIRVSSPLDLDFDGINDIEYSATQENLENVLASLERKMQKGDHLFFFAIGHGAPIAPKSYLMLWGDNSDLSKPNRRLYDEELEEMLRGIVNKGVFVSAILGQCYSGGFVENLESIGCVVATACKIDEKSFALHDTISSRKWAYDEFLYHWTSAMNSVDPYGNVVNADADNNGVISMLEAFNYAKNNDYYFLHPTEKKYETPQYASSTVSLGEDLAFNHLPEPVDLFIRDNAEDTGKEPSGVKGEIFWQSPSIWVRDNDDNEAEHQNPAYSADDSEAFVYVKVHNRGKDNYTGGTKWLHVNWALASTAASVKSWCASEVYGGLPTGGALTPVVIPALTSGDSCIVKVPWGLPVEQMQRYANSERHHLSLLAKISDTSTIEPYIDNGTQFKFDVDSLNNFAQKSVALVSKTQTTKNFKIFMRNIFDIQQSYLLELRPHAQRDTLLFSKANIELQLTHPILNAWAKGGYCGENISYSPTTDSLTIGLNSANGKLKNLMLEGGQVDLLSLKFDFHTPSPLGITYSVDLIQRDQEGIMMGGQTFVIDAPFAIASVIDSITPPGPIYPIDPELPPIGDGIITLGANLDGTELISEWTDANGSVIGNSTTVEVTPTPQNDTYSLRVLTTDGGLYNDSITLDPTLGIKSVTKSVNNANCVVVEFLSETFAPNSYLTLQSVNQAMNPIKYSVPIGIESYEIDMTNLSPGLYAVTYIVDGAIINTAKFSK